MPSPTAAVPMLVLLSFGNLLGKSLRLIVVSAHSHNVEIYHTVSLGASHKTLPSDDLCSPTTKVRLGAKSRRIISLIIS